MPTPTYTPLATLTLASATSSVTFSNIPATYRDLILITDGSLASANEFRLRFNSDTGSNYPKVIAQGFTGGTFSVALTSTSIVPWDPNNLEANSRFAILANVMDYSATDKHKTALIRTNGRADTTPLVSMAAGRWANTAAINSVNVSSGANFNIGSTFSLYGVIA